jgi:hypothetical protein
MKRRHKIKRIGAAPVASDKSIKGQDVYAHPVYHSASDSSSDAEKSSETSADLHIAKSSTSTGRPTKKIRISRKNIQRINAQPSRASSSQPAKKKIRINRRKIQRISQNNIGNNAKSSPASQTSPLTSPVAEPKGRPTATAASIENRLRKAMRAIHSKDTRWQGALQLVKLLVQSDVLALLKNGGFEERVYLRIMSAARDTRQTKEESVPHRHVAMRALALATYLLCRGSSTTTKVTTKERTKDTKEERKEEGTRPVSQCLAMACTHFLQHGAQGGENKEEAMSGVGTGVVPKMSGKKKRTKASPSVLLERLMLKHLHDDDHVLCGGGRNQG